MHHPLPGPRLIIVTARALDPFEQRWLAEATRRRETHTGALDDAAANRAARAHGGDLETRIRHRALILDADKGGMASELIRWAQHARLAAVVLAALAVLTGASMAASVLGNGQRPVNVVWALGGLLGVHLITLVPWLVRVSLPDLGQGPLAGRLWLWITRRLGRHHGETWVPDALLAMARRHGVVGAWFGRLSHGLWTLTLCSALLTLLVLLSTRRYGFVWETTILSDTVFVSLTEALGRLPALLGLSMPDAEMVRRAAAPDAFPADRQVWSAWLLAALVTYGILPRALLWATSQWRWQRFRARFRLDLDEPGYARLAARLVPATESTGVSDAEPQHLPDFHAHAHGPVSDGPHQALALELGPDLPWPPPQWPAALAGGRLDSRDHRRQALDTLAAHPLERLLVAVDARQSPDRGALALLAELSRYAHRMGVWLAGDADDPARPAHWRDALAELGLAAEAMSMDGDSARQWLEQDDD